MLSILRPSFITAVMGATLLLSAALWPVPAARADDHGRSSSASSKPARHSFRVEQPGDYGRYRQDFTELCARIGVDGRQGMLYDMLLPISEKDPACLDCRPLINQWASVCRPKPARAAPTPVPTPEEGAEEAVEIPSPTPTPSPARLPSIAVLDALSELVRRMAADTGRVEKTIQAIDKIHASFVSAQGKNAAQREYFDALAAYLISPFEEPRAAIAAAAKHAPDEEGEEGHDQSSAAGTEGLFDH